MMIKGIYHLVMTNIANSKDPPSLIVQSVQSTISMGHFSVRYVKLPEGKLFFCQITSKTTNH